jgi:parvulin-like peptidyl-prolyl isomerase
MAMKYVIGPIIIGIVLVLSTIGYSQVIDKTVAIVNDEVISQAEIDSVLASLYIEYKGTYKGAELAEKMEEARRNILKQLVEDKLVLQKAKSEKIEVPEKEVQERMERVKSKFSSEKEFLETLEKENLTKKKLESRYRDQLMMRKLFEREVMSKITVSPTEIVDYYQSHPNNFKEPGGVKIKGLIVKSEEGQEDEAMRLAWLLIDEIKSGKDFDKIVDEHTDDPCIILAGSDNFVKNGELNPEVEEVVFNMEIGEVSSEPILINPGYCIFKVVDKKTGGVKEFSEVEARIQNIIFNSKVQKALREWINNLKDESYISIN